MKKSIIFLTFALYSATSFADSIYVHSTIILPDSVLVKSVNVGPVKHPFWDNLPSIITGLISIGAIGLSFWSTGRNIKASKDGLEKQLTTQLATTVEKEWVQNVRKEAANVISQSIIASSILFRYPSGRALSETDSKAMSDAFNSLISSKAILMLYLNGENTFEKALSDAIENVHGELGNSGKKKDAQDLLGATLLVSKAAHSLFKNRKAA